MKFQSQVFLLFGFLSLVGIFIAQKLIISYNLGGEGVNLLPINFFEFLLLLLSFLIFLISILITFILSKKIELK